MIYLDCSYDFLIEDIEQMLDINLTINLNRPLKFLDNYQNYPWLSSDSRRALEMILTFLLLASIILLSTM